MYVLHMNMQGQKYSYHAGEERRLGTQDNTMMHCYWNGVQWNCIATYAAATEA